jgi:hypothetical protein
MTLKCLGLVAPEDNPVVATQAVEGSPRAAIG